MTVVRWVGEGGGRLYLHGVLLTLNDPDVLSYLTPVHISSVHHCTIGVLSVGA